MSESTRDYSKEIALQSQQFSGLRDIIDRGFADLRASFDRIEERVRTIEELSWATRAKDLQVKVDEQDSRIRALEISAAVDRTKLVLLISGLSLFASVLGAVSVKIIGHAL